MVIGDRGGKCPPRRRRHLARRKTIRRLRPKIDRPTLKSPPPQSPDSALSLRRASILSPQLSARLRKGMVSLTPSRAVVESAGVMVVGQRGCNRWRGGRKGGIDAPALDADDMPLAADSCTCTLPAHPLRTSYPSPRPYPCPSRSLAFNADSEA